MSGQIKCLASAVVFTTAAQPVWVNGIWECGDQRFTDPTETQYQVVSVYPELTPMQFYLAFTPIERMKIKALATSGIPANSPLLGGSNAAIPQDAIIAEFWATYTLATQVNSPVNPNLVSIQEGLAYLASPTAPTPAVITTARIPQISAGIAQ